MPSEGTSGDLIIFFELQGFEPDLVVGVLSGGGFIQHLVDLLAQLHLV